VRLDMVASVDHGLFMLLRSLADVVLVAAGTARAERYGPSRVPVAVVTRSCRLDWEAPFFRYRPEPGR
jgi:riboflavin biosynthesis pyrimidine reductase